MKQRKLKFAAALLPSGWTSDVTLSLDGDGMITDVAAGDPNNTAKAIM